MTQSYYYEGQLRRYMILFNSIFEDLCVRTGSSINDCNRSEFLKVPIVIGSQDRVFAAIENGNTNHRPLYLPIGASSYSLERGNQQYGSCAEDERTVLKPGGAWPNDLETVKRMPPLSYELTINLDFYCSNRYQLEQIIEQICLMFPPNRSFFISDKQLDWIKLTKVILESQSSGENYPIGTDNRVLTYSFNFKMPIYLSGPMYFTNKVVKSIDIQIGDMAKYEIDNLAYPEKGEFRNDGVFANIELG